MNRAFRNERSSKNERREMNRRNEPKMNPQNHVEMNRRNERQKNRRNEPIKPTIAVKNFNKLNQTNIQKGDDNMNINIDRVKRIVQNGTNHYIVGIKLVTFETAETVLFTIKKDLMIYKKDIERFVVSDNTIKIGLKDNATLYVYYFTNKDVFDEVIKELPKFNVEILNL